MMILRVLEEDKPQRLREWLSLLPCGDVDEGDGAEMDGVKVAAANIGDQLLNDLLNPDGGRKEVLNHLKFYFAEENWRNQMPRRRRFTTYTMAFSYMSSRSWELDP